MKIKLELVGHIEVGLLDVTYEFKFDFTSGILSHRGSRAAFRFALKFHTTYMIELTEKLEKQFLHFS